MAEEKPPIWNLPTVNKNHLQSLTEEELFNSCKLNITMSYNHATKFTELMAFDYRTHLQQLVADHLAAFKQQYPIKCSAAFEAKMVREAKSHHLHWTVMRMPTNTQYGIPNNASQPISSPNLKNPSNFLPMPSNNNILPIPATNNNNNNNINNINNINSCSLNQSGPNNIPILLNSNNNNAFRNMPHFLSLPSIDISSSNVQSNNNVASNANTLNGNNNIKTEVVKIEPPTNNSQQNINCHQSDDDSDCQIISVVNKKRPLDEMKDNLNPKVTLY